MPKTEQEYIDAKKKKITEKDGKAKADEWEKNWKSDPDEHYKPKFEELFNTTGDVHGSQNNDKAKYTIIVKTTYIEPGFNVGVMRKPAHVSFEFIIVEKANPSNVICKLEALEVPGAEAAGYDFASSSRLKESYAKAAKMLVKYIEKNAK